MVVWKKFAAKNFLGLLVGLVAGGCLGVGAEEQLECLDIPYTNTNKVHLPLKPQISLY